MLHARAGPAALPVVHDLPREAAVQLPAEEREHVLGAQAEGGVPQQPHVEVAQGGATREEHIGDVLGLMRRPVVAIAFELIAQERVHPVGEAVEHGGPVEGRKAIGEPLDASRAPEPEEGILEAAIAQPALVHLGGKPLVAVDVDLHREGEPGLHARVAEAELAVEEVEVQEETLPPRRSDGWPALPIGQAEAAAGSIVPNTDTRPSVIPSRAAMARAR